MFKQNHRVYSTSDINILQSEIEYYKSSKEYFDILSLLIVCLRIVCQPDCFFKHFIILNTRLGIIAEILDNLKKDTLLISDHYEEYYFTPEKYRHQFKVINWQKNKIVKLAYNPDVLIDFTFSLSDISSLDFFLTFLDNQNNPTLILLVESDLDINLIINKFESANYVYEKDLRDEIYNIVNDKLVTFKIDKLLVFTYKHIPIIKEDIGLVENARGN